MTDETRDQFGLADAYRKNREHARATLREWDHGVHGLNDVLSPTPRTDLVADIVGHPTGMPSLPELEYLHDIDRAALVRHLAALKDADIVVRVSYSVDEQPADAPKALYRLTDDARRIFDTLGFFDPEVRRPLYAQVAKPPEIQRLEALPRPNICDNDP